MHSNVSGAHNLGRWTHEGELPATAAPRPVSDELLMSSLLASAMPLHGGRDQLSWRDQLPALHCRRRSADYLANRFSAVAAVPTCRNAAWNEASSAAAASTAARVASVLVVRISLSSAVPPASACVNRNSN